MKMMQVNPKLRVILEENGRLGVYDILYESPDYYGEVTVQTYFGEDQGKVVVNFFARLGVVPVWIMNVIGGEKNAEKEGN